MLMISIFGRVSYLPCEPMVNQGVADIAVLDDQWTTTTADQSMCAHFEHTLAITKDGPVRLTGPPTDDELELVPEGFRDSSQWVVW